MQSTKQRYWQNPDVELAWRPIDPYCQMVEGEEYNEPPKRGDIRILESTMNSITIGWDAATDTDGSIESYIIYMRDTDTPNVVNTYTYDSNTLSYTFTNLEFGSYYFSYRAVDNKGLSSSESNTITGTTTFPKPPKEIDIETKIAIIFDDSGSMDSTYDDLVDMRDTYLKDELKRFYATSGNDGGDKYDEMVTIRNFNDFSGADERTYYISNELADENTILLFFQDEADSTYYIISPEFPYYRIDPITGYMLKTTQFYEDMTTFTSTLQQQGYNQFIICIFQVTGQSSTWTNSYKKFLEEIDMGLGSNGLGWYENYNVINDVRNNESGTYYTQQIITALQDLGFNV